MASSVKITASNETRTTESVPSQMYIGRPVYNFSRNRMPTGPSYQLPVSRNQRVIPSNLLVDQNQTLRRNTLVITNSDYRSEQQGLSGISFRNKVCIGLPENVSWEELLRERPYDGLYLRNLLECTRALNREYKRKRKPRIQPPPRQDKTNSVTPPKSIQKPRSINSADPESNIAESVGASKVENIIAKNVEIDVPGNSADEQLLKKETCTSRSDDACEYEGLGVVVRSSTPNNESCNLVEPRLKNLLNESWLSNEDDAEDSNIEEILKNINARLSELTTKEDETVVAPPPSNLSDKGSKSPDTDKRENVKNNSSKKKGILAEHIKKRKRKKNKDREIARDIEKSGKLPKPDDDLQPFENYYDEETIENGIRNGTMFQAILRINSRNTKEAYINCLLDNKDIFIDGIRDRNRALDGDEVVVELHPEEKWKWYPDKTHQKCGKVVAIVQKNHPRTAVGHLIIVYGKSSGIILWPKDNRLPRIRVSEDCCPPKFRVHHQRYKNSLFLAKIVSWEAVKSATGIVLRSLGDESSIDVESECILLENNLNMDPLNEDVELPALSDDIPEAEIQKRVDIRKQCVFTIDPPSAKDLDDALSWRSLPNGNVEVGVHIADVTHYVMKDTLLDQDVKEKATSVYLIDKVYHMLPPKLCQICSLLPGKDKLAFSVFIELNEAADVVKHSFNKTVLRSCAQLSYDHAQAVIDSSNQIADDNTFPPIGNGYTVKDCANTIWELHTLAVKMRKRRFSQGALRIDQPKIVFQLNECKLPTSYTLYEGKECNWLVEEFMLLANILSANEIRKSFPAISLLRFHAAPKEKSLSTVAEYLEKVGIHIDMSSAGSIYKSMMAYDCSDELGVARMTVIMHLLVKPMIRACYSCSSPNVDNMAAFWHYALNTPLYTHFTSPIRRYADVVVHRLLGSAIGFTEAPNYTSDDIQKIAVNCNVKRNAAKKASEQSTELFLRLYVEKNGAKKDRAVVIEVREKFFDIICLSTRFVGRIYVNRIEGLESVDFRQGNGVPTLTLKWKENEDLLYVQIFSVVDVEMFHKKTDDRYSSNGLQYTLLK